MAGFEGAFDGEILQQHYPIARKRNGRGAFHGVSHQVCNFPIKSNLNFLPGRLG
jgi:hypothetical protein